MALLGQGPGHSPDLNPIEYLWDPRTSVNRGRPFKETRSRLVNSMTRPCQAVGHVTHTGSFFVVVYPPLLLAFVSINSEQYHYSMNFLHFP